jgi:uroporphyrinogen decarboxylase
MNSRERVIATIKRINPDRVPIDLGGNESGIYSTQTVREMFIPYIRDFYEHVRKISNYYIIFHSDGSIYQYIPDLIDAGVDILNPVQVGISNVLSPTDLYI